LPNGGNGFSADLQDSGEAAVNRARTIAAWVLLVGSAIGWPVSAMTVFRNEPQGVLGLSWGSIILQAAELLTSSQLHEKQDTDS
jgi:hypothetical protein